MIEFLKGEIAELTPTMVVLDVGGVGYGLFISLQTYGELQGRNSAKLFVSESIREDAHLLYGFAGKQEREWFNHLITVSGIGGQTARMVLSAYTPAELAQIVREENVRALKSVKGIGPKAAQRIIVDLKDKIISVDSDIPTTGVTSNFNIGANRHPQLEEAISALITLGFAPPAAGKIAGEIVKENPSASVETIIKESLKRL